MAGSGARVYDITLVVTEQSPATTTLRPTLAVENDPTVTNPAQAVDGSLTSYAELADASSAIMDLLVFENTRLVSDAGRDWVTLRMTADWDSEIGGEFAILQFRGNASEGWTTLDTDLGASPNWDGSEREFDITAAAASFLEADWELRINFFTGGAATFRMYDARVEVGGDVVAPTPEEIAEDVETLGLSKFTEWWEALTATVEAALVEFGGTASERDSILNEIRDNTTAVDAQGILTTSAARATAEAYEEMAVGIGVPRYTGDPE